MAQQATKRRPNRAKRGRAAAATAEPSLGDAIARASRRWRVPVWVLVAVKLIETGSGSGKGAKSSAGAEGPFQFMPGTARGLGVKDPNNYYEAADGAARLLAGYKRKYGTWNAAFEAYNGGPGAVGQGYAYNRTDAENKLRENGLSELLPGAHQRNVSLGSKLGELPLFKSLNPFNWFKGDPSETPLGEEAGRIKKGGEAAGDAASIIPGAIGDFFEILTKGETWIRLLETLAGAILIYLGLRSLTGVGFMDLPGARTARAAARV